MGMHGLGALTAKQDRRLYFIKEIGCVACLMKFGSAEPGGDGHHCFIDNKPRSHDDMVCLCKWHHLKRPPNGYTERRALQVYGPSRHGHAVLFEQEFGTDAQLLEFQNARLKAYCDSFVISPL